MTVYLRPGSNIYAYEFTLAGTRYRGSTGETDKDRARIAEGKARAEAAKVTQAEANAEMTLYALAQHWLTASKATHKDHQNNVSRVRKLFGDELRQVGRSWIEHEGARHGLPKTLKTHEVTQAHLATLKAKRIEEGCKAATINREMSLMQSLLGYAPSVGAPVPPVAIVWSTRNNRAASLKLPETKGRLRWLTVEEERQVLDGLMLDAERRPGDLAAQDAWHLCQFLLDTGARYNEVARVTWDMIDLEKGTINLYRGKVDNESTLRIPSRTLALLKERREWMGEDRTYVFPKLRGRTWGETDEPRGHATSSIQRHLDGLGGERATPHSLRHTFASRLLQAGVSLAKVSKLLGHSSVAMTARYAHLAQDALHDEALDVLERLHRATHTKPLTPQSPSYPIEVPGEGQVVDTTGIFGRTYKIRTCDQRIKSPYPLYRRELSRTGNEP